MVVILKLFIKFNMIFCNEKVLTPTPKSKVQARVGKGISFRKIPRNRLGIVFVNPRKKVLIPRHSKVHGRANSEARKGNTQEKLV